MDNSTQRCDRCFGPMENGKCTECGGTKPIPTPVEAFTQAFTEAFTEAFIEAFTDV